MKQSTYKKISKEHGIRSTLVKKLDVKWQTQVHKPNCEVCGHPGREAHHFISRSNLNLRWNIRNGFNLCHDCHEKARSREWFKIEMKYKRPLDMEYCEREQYPIRPWKDCELEDLLKTI